MATATYSHPQHTYNSVCQVTPLKERQQNSSNGGKKWLDLIKICHKHATFPSKSHIITQLPIHFNNKVCGRAEGVCAAKPIEGHVH